MGTRKVRRKESGFAGAPKAAQVLEMMRPPVGQRCPTQKPMPEGAARAKTGSAAASDRLGSPLNIGQVAAMLGCSPWSIRNTWIPKGLPFFRSGASSRLIFFEAQVVRWIEHQQAKGG